MHLNLRLCIHLLWTSFVFENLLCAGHCWQQQEGPQRRPSFLGRPLSGSLAGGQAKLGVDTAVTGDGQLQTFPGHPQADTVVRSWRAVSSAAWEK